MFRSIDRIHARAVKARSLNIESLESRIVLDSTVVFSELMYNPGADQNLEWIELFNEMAVDMDISNWRIDGVGYTFPEGTVLSAQQFLVVAKSPDRFAARYDDSTDYGPYSGRLSNGGESVRLINNSGRVMDEVDYQDMTPWPVAADGSGASLAKVDLDGGSESAANWQHSKQIGGSPAAMNIVSNPSEATIVFSELSQRTRDEFFIELVNQSDEPVNLDGYSISSAGVEAAYSLSGSVAAGDFLSIDQAALPFSTFDIDRLFLYSPGSDSVEDAVVVTDSPQARSFDGPYAGRWLTPESSSPGSANSISLESDVVINEILYHGPGFAVDDQPATFETTVLLPIDENTTWRYRADAAGLATGWATETHADGDDGWKSGAGLFGFERASLGIPIRTEFPNPATIFPGITTYYFETEFQLDAGQIGAENGMALRHMIDDGAVFYVNGQEFLRYNMPNGEISSSTFAESVPDAVFSDASAIPVELLHVGVNLLSVEVHQASVASNDVIFGAELLQRRAVTEFIPGQPFTESDEEWIEIYNRSDRTIDLSGWQLADAVEFTFPDGTTIGPGEYRLVARDADELAENYPDKANLIVGGFQGVLSNRSDNVRLADRVGNPVDELRYFDGGRWHEYADGGGASLELVSPHADNRLPESWATSVESGRSEWQTIEYEAVVQPDGFSGSVSSQYHEFILGLLDSGEVLIDDVSVLENGVGGIERIQNGTFENDSLGGPADKWRIAGNHAGIIVADPDDARNQVLRLTATGAMEDRLNHAETTFVDNAAIREGVTYRISFRAKWFNGSNQVHSRLYFDRLPKTTRLARPENAGTPGEQNSNFRENVGPGLEDLLHSPTIPAVDQPVTVSIRANDPDGVDALELFYSVDENEFQMLPMEVDASGRFAAMVPGQASGDIVQFFVQAKDGRGAISQFPAGGADSRALYQVPNQGPRDGIHNFRIIMTTGDSRLMHDRTNVTSNERLGATVVYNESEVFYDVGVRLKGSNAGRSDVSYLGFNVRFDPTQLFRGVHETVAIDRSGRSGPTPRTQDEILIKHIANKAGDIPYMYDDLVHVIAPRRSHTRSALLMMARYGDEFLDTQFENGSDGTVFKLDIAYLPNGTTNRDPESPKVAFPYSHPQPTRDLEDLGEDKEAYRTHLLIRNNRDRDDYSRIIEASQVLDQRGGKQLVEAAAEVIDIDQWARTFALQSLTGAADVYTRGALHHNIEFYVRPSDNRVLALPWDWDFAFTASTNQPLIGTTGNGGKLMGQPTVRRLYHGHLLDIINTTFNNDYLDRWIDHYGAVAKQNLGSLKSYVSRRREFVLDRLPTKTDFEITTNGGVDFETEEHTITITGNGWIDVREIRLGQQGEPVAIEWLDDSNWQIDVPLNFGSNQIDLIAYDHQGAIVGQDSIRVTSTRQFGDLNQDGMLDVADIDLIAAAIRSGQGGVDLDGDGAVSQMDHAFLVREIFHTDYGDSNLDGVFDSNDIVLVFQAAEYEDTIIGNSTWAAGDWNGDGEFSTSDWVFAFQTGNYV